MALHPHTPAQKKKIRAARKKEERVMNPEWRKKLEQFLFGLRPKEEEEFKFPWGERVPLYTPGEGDDWLNWLNIEPLRWKKTSRDAEQQMQLRNWRLIHSRQYNPGLLV